MRPSLRIAGARISLAVFFLVMGAARVSQGAEPTVEGSALDLFEKSEAAYDGGHFVEAITLLTKSYALKKEPVLLYNLGRAYEGVGDLTKAAESYEAFLVAQPAAPDRGALERRIVTLRRQLAEREALRKQAVRPRPPARGASAVPWLVAGLGAASVVGGSVLGILARARNDEAKREPTYTGADRLHSQAESLATGGAVCFVAGGVLVAGGIVWGLLDISAAKRARLSASGLLLTF